MASWDEYAIKKTLLEEGIEKGREEGIGQKSYMVVKNLLAAGKFSIAEIAGFADVSEAFVKKVQADLHKRK